MIMRVPAAGGGDRVNDMVCPVARCDLKKEIFVVPLI
jgi:hypothetical protein